ncbi:CPBP family intramembrane glutamic endopeptidase [Nitrospirillum iridis]|uniref:Membrane protease YdiL (CAAX protease family) n=1 Tax=Nitrospirillum iridis TaxID=765888 RepID=A0A7X0AUA3_9PROT|nr:type II CAAX endopeptidase family protein [Nitrospirillum iridis]MBB6250237.1 membrane protease YdiL (CAAX protease family) [Nitrospirillum iridis]
MILLVLFLGTLAVWVYRDMTAYAAFKKAADTRVRQAFFRSWVVVSALLFGVGTIVALALLGRLPQLWQPPSEFAALASGDIVAPFREALADRVFLMFVGGAFLAGRLIPTLVHARLTRQSPTRPLRSAVPGDVQALLPRNGAERLWAAALSVNAGVTEELAFRLLLPLLITLVTGNPGVAFILSGAAFGLVHLYQGWAGVLATTLAGAVLSLLYLATGSLLAPILLHIAIDMFGLLVQPLLERWALEAGQRSRGHDADC